MGSSEVRAGAAYVELLLKNSAFTKGLKASSKQLRDWGGTLTSAGGLLSAGGAGLLAPFIASIKHFADFGSQLNDMSTRTGVSAAALGELKYAAEQTGAGLEDVESGLRKMEKFLAAAKEGAAENRVELARLGLTMDDLKGKSPEEAFDILAHKIDGVKDPIERAAAAMKVLGKGGTALLPMIAEMDVLRQKARELGLAPTQAAVAAADQVGDELDTIKSAAGATFFEIGYALSGAVTEGAKVITGIITSTTKWVKENHDLVQTIAAVGGGMLIAGAAVTALGLSATITSVALGGIATAIGFVGSVLGVVLSPLGLISGALVGGIAYWALYSSSGQKAVTGVTRVLGGMLTTVRRTMGGIFDAIAAGNLPLAGDIAITGLRLVFLQGMTALSTAVGGSFGELLGTLGTQIAGGDFAGAWTTAVTAMAMVWDQFSQGVVSVFTEAMDAVINAWKSATSAISDFILADAAKGGIIGSAALLGSGVDVQKEAGRAELLRRQQISSNTQRLGGAQGELDQSKKNGGTFTDASGTYTTEQLQKYVDEIKQRLADLKAPIDFVGEVQATARAQISGTASSVRDVVDKFAAETQQQADANAAASKAAFDKNVAGGKDKADKTAEELRNKLAALNAQAKQERDDKADAADGANKKQREGAEGLSREVSGTFSAAALTAGGVSSPMERVAAAVEEGNKKAEIALKKQDKIIVAIENGGVFV